MSESGAKIICRPSARYLVGLQVEWQGIYVAWFGQVASDTLDVYEEVGDMLLAGGHS